MHAWNFNLTQPLLEYNATSEMPQDQSVNAAYEDAGLCLWVGDRFWQLWVVLTP
jgi:hypothetical protein